MWCKIDTVRKQTYGPDGSALYVCGLGVGSNDGGEHRCDVVELRLVERRKSEENLQI